MDPILADLIQDMKDYAAEVIPTKSRDEFVENRAAWLVHHTGGDRDHVIRLMTTVKADEMFLENAGAGEFHYALRLGMIFGHAIRLIETADSSTNQAILKANPEYGRF
jgi:hypothetical protein